VAEPSVVQHTGFQPAKDGVGVEGSNPFARSISAADTDIYAAFFPCGLFTPHAWNQGGTSLGKARANRIDGLHGFEPDVVMRIAVRDR